MTTTKHLDWKQAENNYWGAPVEGAMEAQDGDFKFRTVELDNHYAGTGYRGQVLYNDRPWIMATRSSEELAREWCEAMAADLPDETPLTEYTIRVTFYKADGTERTVEHSRDTAYKVKSLGYYSNVEFKPILMVRMFEEKGDIAAKAVETETNYLVVQGRLDGRVQAFQDDKPIWFANSVRTRKNKYALQGVTTHREWTRCKEPRARKVMEEARVMQDAVAIADKEIAEIRSKIEALQEELAAAKRTRAKVAV